MMHRKQDVHYKEFHVMSSDISITHVYEHMSYNQYDQSFF